METDGQHSADKVEKGPDLPTTLNTNSEISDHPAPPTQSPSAVDVLQKDVVMAEPERAQATPPAAPVQIPSPAPVRVATPSQGSRAASVHPDPNVPLPAELKPHGDPTRRYLNTKVTGVLLEGMKQLAKEQPSDPLRVLGEFLIERSKAVERPN